MNRCIVGDCLDVLPTLEAGGVQCCVTSPPYWGLRDYGTATWKGGNTDCDHLAPKAGGTGAASAIQVKVKRIDFESGGQFRNVCKKCGALRIDSQLGREATPEAYVAKLVAVFREVKRVLRDDGTLWLNLGDSYAANRSYQVPDSKWTDVGNSKPSTVPLGLKPKDLVGIPWRVAFALQADGWYLRQDIIWSKPNPMPESVRDRCTKSHEYIFMLTKNERYYYDADAIAEPLADSTLNDARMTLEGYETGRPERGYPGGASHGSGMLMPRRKAISGTYSEDAGRNDGNRHPSGGYITGTEKRNKRSVWTVTTKPFNGAHFATFPPGLIEPCILAGSKPGDLVLDPFGGSGTTGEVAEKLGRRWLLIELNPEYEKLSRERTAQQGLVFQ